MRTNIDIDDELMQQAMAASKATTKKAVVEQALRLMVQLKHQGAAIEGLWGIATWAGPDDDWFAPDPLMTVNTKSAQRQELSESSSSTPGQLAPAEAVCEHGHR